MAIATQGHSVAHPSIPGGCPHLANSRINVAPPSSRPSATTTPPRSKRSCPPSSSVA